MPLVYTFFAELSRFDRAITLCYNEARAKEKSAEEIAVPSPLDAIHLSILHHHTTSKILTCQDFLQGIASSAQKFCLTKGHEMTTNEQIPKMLTIRETARTGILPETALRRLAAEGRLPCIYVGRKALVNFDALVEQLNGLAVTE